MGHVSLLHRHIDHIEYFLEQIRIDTIILILYTMIIRHRSTLGLMSSRPSHQDPLDFIMRGKIEDEEIGLKNIPGYHLATLQLKF